MIAVDPTFTFPPVEDDEPLGEVQDDDLEEDNDDDIDDEE